jgi:hypothetical protein
MISIGDVTNQLEKMVIITSAQTNTNNQQQQQNKVTQCIKQLLTH